MDELSVEKTVISESIEQTENTIITESVSEIEEGKISIAKQLLKEFNISEAPMDTRYTDWRQSDIDAARRARDQAVGKMAPGQAAPEAWAVAGRQANVPRTQPQTRPAGQSAQAAAPAAQPATSATGEWTPTPEQEKWLGGANRQDPYIMNRMPGQKPLVSHFKDPADQALAKKMGFPEKAAAQATGAAPAGTATTVTNPAQAQQRSGQAAQPADDRNEMDKASDAAAAANSGEAAAAMARSVQSARQGTIDPAKLNRFKELLAKAGGK